MSRNPPDTLQISSLQLTLPAGLGPSAFGLSPPPPCPALLSLNITLDDRVVPSCTLDDTMGGLGINYSSTSKAIIALVGARDWSGPEELIRAVAGLVLSMDVVLGVDVRVELGKALLPAQAAVYSARFEKASKKMQRGQGERERTRAEDGIEWTCEIKELRVRTIIGLHQHEREMRQWLELDLGVVDYAHGWNHRVFAEGVYDWLDQSSYRTIEALIDALALYILTNDTFASMIQDNSTLCVTLRKPSALAFACPVLTIRRQRADYTTPNLASNLSNAAGSSKASSRAASGSNRVSIAIGSNIGDRIGHLRKAVDHLESQEGVRVKTTSRLYESEPMYVEDQDRFINGVIELETALPPLEVLRLLKRTEKLIGRTKTFRNGPRVVDLDLLVYGDEIVKIGQVDDADDADGVGWLECPHPRIAEREFVLRPLADFAPDLILPGTQQTISTLLRDLLKTTPPSLAPIIPFPYPARPLRLERGTTPRLMQIFNATPDSFSDGSKSNLDIAAALSRIREIFSTPHPPDILDIGGMSTRPNSQPCTIEEERDRVIPLITAIRQSPNVAINSIPISIDTYRPEIAEEAIKAGASCINDVRGGTEPGMLEVMARARVPVVLMHSRGDSTTMQSPEAQDYTSVGGVVDGVRSELGKRVEEALKVGVRRWDLIIDPGLGFAKGQKDNLRLLQRVGELNARGSGAGGVLNGLPILVGGSRKGFVGRVIGRTGADEAAQRGYGDAGVVAWCAGGVGWGQVTSEGPISAGEGGEDGEEDEGVAILRVHDTRAMGEVLSMVRAIQDA